MLPPLEQDSPLQPDAPDRQARTKPKHGAGAFLRELPILILIAFGLAMLIKTFLVQAFFIPSESMEPTLHGCAGCRGDRVLVNKLVYRFRKPRRGEIIVFVAEHDPVADKRSLFRKAVDSITEGLGVSQPADKDFIKRVIGLPGETVQMKDGVVTITTTAGAKLTLNEPYLGERDLTPFGPATVPPNRYFVMGDNRANSLDSRASLGTIRRSDIVGKAFVKVWPFGRLGLLRAPSYEAPTAAAAGVVVSLPLLIRARSRRRSLRRAA